MSDHGLQPAWAWAGFTIGTAGLALHTLQLQPWTLDDAFISFRYAENLASGHGLVYNPGEAVEGYTTFLWVLLLGIGGALGLQTPALAKVLGLLAALATLVLIASAHRLLDGVDARAAGIGAAILGTCGVFSSWAMPGMEVPLVALLLTGVLFTTHRTTTGRSGSTPAGVLAALALMARPDAIVVVGVCGVAWLATAARTRSLRPAAAMLPLVGLYVPYFVWRFVTYGWLLPNTFYAKVGATEAQVWRGLDYVGHAGGALGPLALLAVAGAWRGGPGAAVFGGAVVGQVGYVLAVGGDVMPAFRFFTGLTPILALLAGRGLSRAGSRAAIPLTAVVVLVNLAVFELHPDLRPRIERGVVGRNGEEVGRWMRANLPRDTLLATNTAGSVPYFSGLRTVDMLGLNDSHIAHRTMPGMGQGMPGHEKADGAYVFARDPDVVQFGSARGRARPAFRSDRELRRQPGFTDRYVVRRYPLPSGAILTLWVRRTWTEDGRVP